MIDVNWRPSPRELRQFAVMGIAFSGLVAGLVLWKGGSATWAATIAGGGVVLGTAGLVTPPLVRPVYVVLMALALPIGWIVSHVLLALIFYGLMTPLGLMLRLLGHDPLRRRFDPGADSYWIPHEPTQETQRYFRQF